MKTGGRIDAIMPRGREEVGKSASKHTRRHCLFALGSASLYTRTTQEQRKWARHGEHVLRDQSATRDGALCCRPDMPPVTRTGSAETPQPAQTCLQSRERIAKSWAPFLSIIKKRATALSV